jgi:hypothetical protein
MPEVLQAFTDGVGQMRVTLRPRSLGWMSRGACLQADPELLFPVAVAGPAARQAEAAGRLRPVRRPGELPVLRS